MIKQDTKYYEDNALISINIRQSIRYVVDALLQVGNTPIKVIGSIRMTSLKERNVTRGRPYA